MWASPYVAIGFWSLEASLVCVKAVLSNETQPVDIANNLSVGVMMFPLGRANLQPWSPRQQMLMWFRTFEADPLSYGPLT